MQCPFCHKEVWGLVYPFHQLLHTRRRPDGQQQDHVTLPPSERDSRSLADVPKVYRRSVREPLPLWVGMNDALPFLRSRN